MPLGLEPKSGSVRPKQPSFSPVASLGSQCDFCSGRAEGVDGVHDERGLDADEAADAGVAALELLVEEAGFDVVHAGAAVVGEGGAVEA